MTISVAHLTASRFFGGPERQMLELANALPAEIRSVFVSFAESGLCHTFCGHARNAGFEAIALQHDTPHLMAAYRELVAALRTAKADVLCCHGYKSNILGLPAARRLGIPIISVSHGWTGECSRVRLYEAIDRRILRWMDKVVCVSEAQAQKVRVAGVSANRCAVMHDAVRAERFADPESSYRDRLLTMFCESPTARLKKNVGAECVSAPTIIVGAAGRLSPEKGFSVLIDAARRICGTEQGGLTGGNEEHGTAVFGRAHSESSGTATPRGRFSAANVGFVLFGDGPLRDSLARQIVDAGLEGRFILAGFHADLDRYIPHLDLFVQSSFTEGLPNVVLEASAAGVAVVATDVGGTREIIQDGISGRLVPAGDSVAIAERIVETASDDQQRRAMAERGRKRVGDVFSFARQSRSYLGPI